MAASPPSSLPWAAASTYERRAARTQGEAALTSEPRSRGGAWCVYARSRGEPANCASRADPFITTGDRHAASISRGAHPRRNEPIAHPFFSPFLIADACVHADHERIRTISFDTESKTIAIVGPFDPHRLACKLRCKGGKVVRDVHIVDTTNGGGGKPPPENMPDAPPAPAPMRNGKKKNKNKEKAPPPAPPPPPERPPSPPPPEPAPGPPPETMMPPPSSPVHHPRPPDTGMSAMVPQPHYVEEKPLRTELEPPMSPPPKEMPPMKESPPPLMMPACPGRPLEQPVDEYVIPTVEIPSWPTPPVGPCGCPCCAPCYQGYYDSCRCGCCGRVYGTTVRPLPAPCGGYRGCRTFSDDDPSATCSVM